MPAIYLGHGAPMLLDDQEWVGQLEAWAKSMPRPKEILIISAHWETAPMAISATERVPLVCDFYGFPEHYYRITYDAPGAPELAAKVRALMPSNEPILEPPTRGLDHGAWVPLKAMYSEADIPVLQLSMPDLDPEHLFEIGKHLAPLRDEGVLIIGSGFMTHGLPFIHEYFLGKPGAPQWSMDFDHWAMEALNRGDIDTLMAFRQKAPGMPCAHPTVEHFAPLFVTLGAVAKPDDKPDYAIEGTPTACRSGRSRRADSGRVRVRSCPHASRCRLGDAQPDSATVRHHHRHVLPALTGLGRLGARRRSRNWRDAPQEEQTRWQPIPTHRSHSSASRGAFGALHITAV